MRPALAVLSLLTLPAALGAGALPAQDLPALSDAELLKLVEKDKNRVDRLVFEELGKRKTRSSLRTLVEAADEVTTTWPLRYAYRSFRHFKGSEDLEQDAIDHLVEQAGSRKPLVSSAATCALALFGEDVHDQLQRVLRSSKDPATRSIAMAPLLPGMAASGEEKQLRTVCENFLLTYTVERALGVETFRSFAASGGADLFSRRLTDKKIPLQLRTMMVGALEATPGDDSLEVLVKGLRARDPKLLYEVLRALSKRGTDRHLESLEKLARHKDDHVRHEALISQARIRGGDPEFLQGVLDLAGHKQTLERGAAAISLGEIRTPEAMQALHLLLDDPEYSVRAQALLAVAAARRPVSVPVLIQRLDRLSGTEKERTLRELRLLTGEDISTATTPWARWWKDQADSFAVPGLEEARKADAERQERRQANQTQVLFYGLRVSSERVCFVVDLSGSMNAKTKSGKTRLGALKTQLDRVVEAYPSGQLFNMIFFGNRAEKWRPELTLMNDELRTEAREHVKGLTAPGATAIYDGLVAAFEDPRVDTIYLLTDGGPSGGTIDDIDEIIAEVRRWNSVRQVVIHSVAVGRDSRLLRTLAEECHGGYVRVD